MKRRMKRWIVATLAVVGGVVLLAFGVGSLLPREHVATSAITLRQAPESVWAVVRDLSTTPRWWDEVTTSTRVADDAGREVWHQGTGSFSMNLVVADATEPVRLVTAIDGGADAAFGGTWTHNLVRVSGGTRVIVTEAGWVANPLFRVLTRLMGYHRTLDSYLAALGRRFGEDVVPEHVVR